MTCCHSASGTSSAGLRIAMPALLIRMSGTPSFFSMVANASSTSSSSVMSQVTAMALPPLLWIVSAVRFA
jgi:hypothetical protein